VSPTGLRAIGLALSLLYAAAIVRVYVRQPATLPEVAGSLTASVGVYRIDQARFDAGLSYFRADKFLEARDAFAQADPARQDPKVQFYTAYSYLREGWGRVYNDPTLYRAGKATLDHAREIAPHGTILIDDPALRLHSAEELEAEFDRGLTHGVSDLNPMRLLRERP
jgi:hypothetical protein